MPTTGGLPSVSTELRLPISYCQEAAGAYGDVVNIHIVPAFSLLKSSGAELWADL